MDYLVHSCLGALVIFLTFLAHAEGLGLMNMEKNRKDSFGVKKWKARNRIGSHVDVSPKN